MHPTKRRRVSAEPPSSPAASDAEVLSEQGPSSNREVDDEQDWVSASEEQSADEHGSPDTEDEIAQAKRSKSKKTLKRKRRATDPSSFGTTLQSLLSTETPTTLPLSLKPSLNRKRNDEKLELKAKKVLRTEKKEKDEKGRIRDVIGGWGGESERALRKVAQRGVVKLFNAIQQTQAASAVAAEQAKANRGTGKPTLPAPDFSKKSKGKHKTKNEVSSHSGGKEATLDKDNFLDIIRSGGLVSKA
ncbi:hypothetical protein GLOTRDRAFT_113176 [Gloeophyllum trabeum ATCC 11539]|uniref:Rrp15p-domain-containing protein n=1 Tax=Gloeophyllum trabeum (strain ATCC 11539 / FP-39264 / Madison 617) TaxID=670483 RepID=S7QMF1_GLOTA|nr:uncharacterized protein GLOTRDRAFT_113176 [Gloeophyllum trabeum ATCC 11539]EPQ60577.1 hypothetical protein GLOTRDRAFT_113176 [Gloeophyllum trabeum ATCC 11539]